MIVMPATLCQESEPPETVERSGSSGRCGRWSRRWPRPGVQAEVLPAPSIERYCTSVSPSAVMLTEAPAVALDQLDPPLVEVRYS